MEGDKTHAIPLFVQTSHGRGRSPQSAGNGRDGGVYRGADDVRGAAGHRGVPTELERRTRPPLEGKAHRDRRPVCRDQGADWWLCDYSGEVEGRGDRADETLPQSGGGRGGREIRAPHGG